MVGIRSDRVYSEFVLWLTSFAPLNDFDPTCHGSKLVKKNPIPLGRNSVECCDSDHFEQFFRRIFSTRTKMKYFYSTLCLIALIQSGKAFPCYRPPADVFGCRWWHWNHRSSHLWTSTREKKRKGTGRMSNIFRFFFQWLLKGLQYFAS